ncbi:hypothetical protein ACFXKD_03365 [Nocardiopsis aegyptia]|uniref:hypothetical protein n=1 Tax=Nocardiopsis aegyptia TaxID=220378 RepID=UPI00366C0229
MSQTKPDPILPDIPKGFSLPFYYGAFTNLGIDYLVPKAKAEQLLKDCAPHAALSVADFDGKACLSLNFQVYYGQFGSGAGVTQEIEFNIVAYPTAAAARVPKLSYERYAMGEEQTGNLGFCRYRVACDSEPAIAAGVELFGEPKFRADFRTAIPVPNGTTTEKKEIVWYETWAVECWTHPEQKPPAKDHQPTAQEQKPEPPKLCLKLTADLLNLPGKTVSAAPFTEFGARGKGESAKALAAPLNVFHPYQWYDLSTAQGKATSEGKARVTLESGGGDTWITSFVTAVKDTKPAGAWLFQSPPVAAQNRPYYLPTTAS